MCTAELLGNAHDLRKCSGWVLRSVIHTIQPHDRKNSRAMGRFDIGDGEPL